MLYKNANIFTEKGFVFGGFSVENGRFKEILKGEIQQQGEDLGGAFVIPGLVDIHIHGAMGGDFSDGDFEGLAAMARYLAKAGITSFAPASMTLPYSTLERAFSTAEEFRQAAPAGCARIAGIHMEGPFFSEKKKGAQNGAYLKLPDVGAVEKLRACCGDLLRIVDLAPELPGAETFAREVSRFCTVSVAHTDGSYEQAKMIYQAGATHLTHLFNAMPALHHRTPGVIAAAAEDKKVQAELICDGIHVHPAMVRLAFALFSDRLCLISDALRCCGMPDGTYDLGGQSVILKGKEARLYDGTLAGSVTNLYEGMLNAIAFGIPKEEAIVSATRNPAKALGLDKEIGTIAVGKRADFVVCDAALNPKAVYIDGMEI